MYFYRWYLEKVAASTIPEGNYTDHPKGQEGDVDGPPRSVITGSGGETRQTDEDHAAVARAAHEVSQKDDIRRIKTMFPAGKVKTEIAPAIRGDHTPAEAQKSKVAGRVIGLR